MEESYEDIARVVGGVDGLRFAINRGANHDVRIGERFLIFRLGDRIIDPDTGEDLGLLEIVLGRARVTHVQQKMSTLESTEERTIPGKVRKIVRQDRAWILGSGNEEIEEGRETKRIPIAVQVGDMARPV